MLQVWGRMDNSWPLPGYSDWTTKWVRSGFSSLVLFPGHSVRAGLQPCSIEGGGGDFAALWGSASGGLSAWPAGKEKSHGVGMFTENLSTKLAPNPALKDMIQLLIWIYSFCCLRQIVCAFRHDWKEGCASTIQSPGLLRGQHAHFCTALHRCSASAEADNRAKSPGVPSQWSCSTAAVQGVTAAVGGIALRPDPAPPHFTTSPGSLDWPKNHLASSVFREDSAYPLSFCPPAGQCNLQVDERRLYWLERGFHLKFMSIFENTWVKYPFFIWKKRKMCALKDAKDIQEMHRSSFQKGWAVGLR